VTGRSRRGHGEGTVYRRPSGKWVAQVDLGWIGGRRRRKSEDSCGVDDRMAPNRQDGRRKPAPQRSRGTTRSCACTSFLRLAESNSRHSHRGMSNCWSATCGSLLLPLRSSRSTESFAMPLPTRSEWTSYPATSRNPSGRQPCRELSDGSSHPSRPQSS